MNDQELNNVASAMMDQMADTLNGGPAKVRFESFRSNTGEDVFLGVFIFDIRRHTSTDFLNAMKAHRPEGTGD